MDDAAVAAAREHFLTSTAVPIEVRGPIWSSWQRARSLELAADRVEPPWRPDQVHDTLLTRAAEPVVDALKGSLGDLSVSVVITDPAGLVLRRETTDRRLAERLDRACLAPGFSYNESFVGTNGIGTSLERSGPTCVVGHEHFAERLADLGCAAAPVKHPLTGRVLGALNLTTWRADAGPVLLALARTTADRLGGEVRDQADVASRALVEDYLRTHHRMPGAVLAVNHEMALVNDAARQDLGQTDRDRLLDLALEALDGGRDADLPVELDGRPAVLRCRIVESGGGGRAGVVSTLERRREPGAAASSLAPVTQVGEHRRLSPWQSLERTAIVEALDAAAGDKAAAAEALGMSRATIYRRIRTYRIT